MYAIRSYYAFLINGRKLWITNGPVAELLIVMARTNDPQEERPEITAFIVEGNAPGLSTEHRCDFMGLKGIQNGLLRFDNVRVPVENIVIERGAGLRLALITLNTGRLTLPAACGGTIKQTLAMARVWANERAQWGAPVGHHEARITSYNVCYTKLLRGQLVDGQPDDADDDGDDRQVDQQQFPEQAALHSSPSSANR